MRATVIPVGVTKETVEGLLRELPRPDSVIVVTVPGYEEVKRPIIETLRGAAITLGASFYSMVVRVGDARGVAEVYRLIKRLEPGEVYLVGITGSRYLLPLLMGVLLWYWRETRAQVYLVHGVEGESYSVEPLPGFFAPAMRLSSVQKRLIRIVYGSEKPLSGRELIKRYGFTRSVYYVLADLERKGLLVVRRNRIERTLPGELLYTLLTASGG